MGLSSADLREIKTVIINTFNDKFLQEIADKLTASVEKRFELQLKEQQTLINSLQGKVQSLSVENSELKKVLDMQEQNSRNLNLRVFGFPVKNGEDVRSEILRFFKQTLNVNIPPNEVIKCHRVATKIASSGPPAVLVRFSTDVYRASVLKSRRLLKSDCGIKIKEDLTKVRLTLFGSAVKKFSSKCAWVLNGNIYVKSGDVVHRVIDNDHLESLK